MAPAWPLPGPDLLTYSLRAHTMHTSEFCCACQFLPHTPHGTHFSQISVCGPHLSPPCNPRCSCDPPGFHKWFEKQIHKLGGQGLHTIAMAASDLTADTDLGHTVSRRTSDFNLLSDSAQDCSDGICTGMHATLQEACIGVMLRGLETGT